ncbi:MAG: hypothetical protein NFW16_02815 [Candidatus Accumulibacter sp.]|uniref:tetratricopeptide repeat protein n=1 Tax=Accumulibacter sp. TaxID=2053492 RepID=UPI00258A5BCF|nr:hypothetical protein [Accumulibacter sp.]MCM8620679.1 hypothetical protein [Accumulibacter sp.]
MLEYKNLCSIFAKCLMALALLSGKPAVAGIVMTEAEYVLLPDFCKSQGNVSNQYFNKYYSAERTNRWQAIMGTNFHHFHHYCWAIVFINRAYKEKGPKGAGGGALKSAIGDINYVVDRATPDFVLLPEVFSKLGEAYLLANDDTSAEKAFRKAWSINPAYWRAYVWWADRLFRQGKLKEALTVAEEGQKNAPGTRALDVLVKDIRAAGRKRVQ